MFLMRRLVFPDLEPLTQALALGFGFAYEYAQDEQKEYGTWWHFFDVFKQRVFTSTIEWVSSSRWI